jgi:hypothetical protein
MGKVYHHIDDRILEWIARQHLFFVSTAPLSAQGHVNCSPKGMDSFRILGPNTVAYLDLTGSGIETIAHLRENKRIVIMFCALTGPPAIYRFHGAGEVLLKGTPEYADCIGHFDELPGARSIIRVQISRISDSCGFGVPKYVFESERETLVRWSENKGDDGVVAFQQENNRQSLDGLPGV